MKDLTLIETLVLLTWYPMRLLSLLSKHCISMQSYRLIYKGWMGLMLTNMASLSVVKDYDEVFIPDEMMDAEL